MSENKKTPVVNKTNVTKTVAKKKAPAKKAPAKKTPAKKTAAKKAPVKKTATKKAPAKKTPAKKKVSTSPYGVALQIMSTNPDMTKPALLARMTKKGMDVETGATAITTAYSCMRTCVRLLRASKKMD